MVFSGVFAGMKMRDGLIGLGFALLFPLLIGAQSDSRIHIDWEKFGAQASDRTEVTLDGTMLRSAAAFLSGNDRDSKGIQKLLSGLQGIYIHSYCFKHEHAYPEADVESVRQQLKQGNWGRIIQSLNHEQGENDEIYLKNTKDDKDTSGLVVLVAEPREFTVVEIVGKIDPKDLDKLDGTFHFHHSSNPAKDEDEN